MRPEQVQDFYPTPGTISTAMFYTGLDPYTLEPVYVPRKSADKQKQRALLQYYRRENAPTVRAALREAGRTALIGSGRDCLVEEAPSGGARFGADARGGTARGKQGAGNASHARKGEEKTSRAKGAPGRNAQNSADKKRGKPGAPDKTGPAGRSGKSGKTQKRAPHR